MIDWNEFRKLIGNKKRKYLQRRKERFHFVSYNEETQQITVMNTKATRTLRVMPLKYFIEDFTFIEMTNEKPLF